MKRNNIISHIGAFILLTILHVTIYAVIRQNMEFIRLSDGDGLPAERLLRTLFISWTACVVFLGIHWVIATKPLRNQ